MDFFCNINKLAKVNLIREAIKIEKNQPIPSTFSVFQKNKNCFHYGCHASTKIVVTIFACHLHKSAYT